MENKLNNHDMMSEVKEYFKLKIEKFGTTAKGVDWNNKEAQYLRFKQITKVIGDKEYFSISDLGCGYGELIHYLKRKYNNFHYLGFDLSEDMILQARSFFREDKCNNYEFIEGGLLNQVSDYVVASGTFNMKLGNDNNEWLGYLIKMINNMNSFSRKGFAFNCLTKYSDDSKMENCLYYADPLFLFDYCKKQFSKNVALLHDYGVYEFTILVRF